MNDCEHMAEQLTLGGRCSMVCLMNRDMEEECNECCPDYDNDDFVEEGLDEYEEEDSIL